MRNDNGHFDFVYGKFQNQDNMTEIIRQTSAVDGKPIFVLKGAIIKHIDEEKNGVSSRTGNSWKLRNINVLVDNGEGTPSDYMRITLRGAVCDKFHTRKFEVNMPIDLEIHFNITNGKYQNAEIIAYDII